MKKLFVIFALLWAVNGWAASTSYYIDASRSVDTGNGLTAATACQKIATCVTKGNAVTPDATTAGAGHNYYLKSGTYTDYSVINNANQAGSTFYGCTDLADLSTCTRAARDTVVIDTGTNHAFYVAVDNVRLRYLYTKVDVAGKYAVQANGSGLDIQYCRFQLSTEVTSASLLNLNGVDGLIFKFNLVEGGMADIPIYLTGDTGGVIAYSIIRGNRGLSGSNWKLGGAVYQGGTNPLYLYNNVIADAAGHTVQFTTASGEIKNNIIFGPFFDAAKYVLVKGSGTVVEDGNILLGQPIHSGRIYSGTFGTGTGKTMTDGAVKFKTYGKKGYLVITSDDAMISDAKRDYIQGLAALLKPYGFAGTYYIQTAVQADYGTAYYSTLRGLYTNSAYSGVWDIGVHSHSHCPSCGSTLGTLTCTGCGTNPRYAVNLTSSAVDGCAARSFCVKTDTGGTEDYTYTLADSSTFQDEFFTALAAIQAGTGSKWGITYSTFDTTCSAAGDNPMAGYVQIGSMADTAGYVAVSTAIALNRTNYDCTSGGCAGWYLNEVYRPKNQLETIINGGGNITDPQTGSTYVANSFSNPYSVDDSGWTTAVRTSGYTSLRSTGTYGQDLTGWNLFTAPTYPAALFKGATKAETEAKVGWLCELAAEYGLVVHLLSHTESELALAGDISWTTVLGVLKTYQDIGAIEVKSAQQVAAILRASPWTYTASTGIAARTYGVAAVDDNNLLSGSPAVYGGVNVGLTTDFDGKTVNNPPSIGAYEFLSGGRQKFFGRKGIFTKRGM